MTIVSSKERIYVLNKLKDKLLLETQMCLEEEEKVLIERIRNIDDELDELTTQY